MMCTRHTRFSWSLITHERGRGSGVRARCVARTLSPWWSSPPFRSRGQWQDPSLVTPGARRYARTRPERTPGSKMKNGHRARVSLTTSPSSHSTECDLSLCAPARAGLPTVRLPSRSRPSPVADEQGARRWARCSSAPGLGPRGATVNRMVDLILRDGPVMKRAMCFSVALAQLIILSTELAYLGFYLHTAAAEDDD